MAAHDDSGSIWVYWLGAIMLWCLALYILALAVFISFLLTVVCIIALRHGSVSLGPVSITADQAAALIALGVIGAVLVPLFLGFCQLFIGTEIAWQYFPQFFFGGYAAGLLGVGVIGPAIVSSASAAPSSQTYLPPAPPPETRLPKPESFRFASWDDEEAGR